MLKRMIKNGYVNINKLLVECYIKIGLNEQELIALMHLFSQYEKNKTINFSSLKSKLTLNIAQTDEIIDELIERGFLAVDIIVKNGRETSSLDVTPTIQKIEEYFYDLDKSEKENEKNNFMKIVISMLETEFGRVMSANDISIISHWEESSFSFDDVKDALFITVKNGKDSLSYMDRVLINARNN